VTARRALIAGGGLGGLTAAVALHQRGWQVCVFEQAPTLEPVGAGISLWPNALRALDTIGVGEAARAQAQLSGPSGVRVPDGRWLSRSDVGAEIRGRFGDPLVLLHRAELAQLLVEQLPFGAVQADTRVLGVHVGADADSAPATLIHQHGETEAELVVAADGIRSVLRGFLYPQYPAPAYAGYTAWRTVLPADAAVTGEPETGFETWGTNGRRFAVLPLSGGRRYCYATATTEPGQVADDEPAELRRLFGDWHEPIPQILAGLSPDQVLRNDVEDLLTPLPAYHRGRVALVGDAAHAMTPDLGRAEGWRSRTRWCWRTCSGTTPTPARSSRRCGSTPRSGCRARRWWPGARGGRGGCTAPRTGRRCWRPAWSGVCPVRRWRGVWRRWWTGVPRPGRPTLKPRDHARIPGPGDSCMITAGVVVRWGRVRSGRAWRRRLARR